MFMGSNLEKHVGPLWGGCLTQFQDPDGRWWEELGHETVSDRTP